MEPVQRYKCTGSRPAKGRKKFYTRMLEMKYGFLKVSYGPFENRIHFLCMTCSAMG